MNFPKITWQYLVLAFALCFFTEHIIAQGNDEKLTQEIKAFQLDQDAHYLNKKTSPLQKKERKKFSGHQFYPIDLNYVVQAKFERITSEDTVEMVTSSGTTKYYRPYARLYFKIGDTDCELLTYQRFALRDSKEYAKYLFLPFRDATSGETSYGGGRYLDLLIPEGNQIILNFNLAYNPYCAYTSGYHCPIPPAVNTLHVPIKAGLMMPEKE